MSKKVASQLRTELINHGHIISANTKTMGLSPWFNSSTVLSFIANTEVGKNIRPKSSPWATLMSGSHLINHPSKQE